MAAISEAQAQDVEKMHTSERREERRERGTRPPRELFTPALILKIDYGSSDGFEQNVKPNEDPSQFTVITDRDKVEKMLTDTGIKAFKIPESRLIPDDAKVLYIGDPYQRFAQKRDTDNTFVLDYQFGEEAEVERDITELTYDIKSFVHFLNRLGPHIDPVKRDIVDYIETGELLENRTLNPFLKEDIADLINTLKAAKETLKPELFTSIDQIPEIIEKFEAVLEAVKGYGDYSNVTEEGIKVLNEKYGSDSDPVFEYMDEYVLGAFSRYSSAYMKLLRNYYKMQKDVIPEVLRKHPDKEVGIEEFKKEISHHFVQKKTEHAHVINGYFPQLPFADNSFDKVLAGWAFSAHIWRNHGSKQMFDQHLNALINVLKPGGEAFITPINYSRNGSRVPIDKLVASLKELEEDKKGGFELIGSDGDKIESLDYIEMVNTLIIKKLKS